MSSSAGQMFEIIREPQARTYRSLIVTLAPWCKTVMLAVRRGVRLDSAGDALVRRMAIWEESRHEFEAWPRQMPVGAPLNVIRYELTPAMVTLLSRCVDRLFDWRSPERPECLCLARRDGTPVLVSAWPRRQAVVWLSDSEYQAVQHGVPRLALSRWVKGMG